MIGTASALPRLLQCPGSAHLEQIRSTSELAEKGAWRHRFLELVSTVGPIEAILHIPEEYQAICEALPTDELPTNLGAEVAFAVDLADGRGWEIGRGLDRAYGDLPAFAIAGTADVVGLSNEVVYIADWKSAGHQGRARDSLQLRFLALAACRAYGRDRATVELIRLSDDGQPRRDAHTYDELDLDAFALELRARLPGSTDRTLHTGPWCGYCPSRPVCPAQSRMAVEVAEGRLFDEPGSLLPLTPERAGVAWDRLKATKALLSHVESAVMATLDEAGGMLPLPGGRQLVKRTVPGNEKLDGEVAFAVLLEQHGQEVARSAVAMTVTKAGIKDALRPIAQKHGQLSKLEKATLEEVRKRDGASRGTRTVVEEAEAPVQELA